ncbi:MAG: hypothetical protein Q9169_005541 [Polycauliona sp. 2 TL-2023]
MAILDRSRESLTGGCLCGAVRYVLAFPQGSAWPPSSHICQCTQCRKHTGSLMPYLITVEPSQLHWVNGSDDGTPPASLKEFSSSKGVYRSFCSSCGCSFTWRSEATVDEIEILIGSIDEKWLIGDRTEKVSSESLTEPGNFEKVLDAEEGALGRELCTPLAGQMFVRNAIKGATDVRLGGKRFVEVSQKKLEIPD